MDFSASMINSTSGYVWVAPTPMVMMPAPSMQEENEIVKPTWRLYANILVAVLQPLQFGWSTSQMNNSIFNNEQDCNAKPIAPGTCLMFPGHTKTQWTIAVSSWIVGGMVGALLIGRVSNKLGRKKTMMANAIFMIAGGAVQAIASDITMFTVGRVFAGIAAGGSTAVIPGFIAGAQQLTGVNAVFFYSSGIFKQAGLSDSRIGVLLVNFVNVLPTLVCGMLAAKVGNRKLILYGFIGMLLSAVGITVSLVASLSPLAIVFVALYVTTFGASLGPLAWGVMADLFPDDVRAVGCSICVACSWLCSLTIGLVYPYLAAALDNYSFVPFMYTITLSFLFFFQIVPDTYGKTIQEIQDEFASKWQKKSKKKTQPPLAPQPPQPQWRMSGSSQIPVLG
ncbi:Major Facilitator Superfamily (MFS) transporter [Phytophthora megakarya]|uniref:Major Facilitator Superfamily (MFS) transporter n=1 Tax=Phytophthora megakarya TaxID=4795 RepID=A0A225WFQ1_9STRA|nr:Major Facilitator Superfamily (MFS) transporter [Phytophthora megakarya]